MNAYLDITCIAVLWVFILDVSGFVASVEKMVQARLPRPFTFTLPRPFSCSKCMTWWTAVAYLIAFQLYDQIWMFAFAGVVASLTPQILRVYTMVASWIDWLTDKLTL